MIKRLKKTERMKNLTLKNNIRESVESNAICL
jgi:hypothetical protein